MDWIDLAQYRVQRRALVSTAPRHHVLRNLISLHNEHPIYLVYMWFNSNYMTKTGQ
jgi:hypothetical protein